MERKQIYLATEQIDELDRLADQRRVPVSQLIREAIDSYLEDARSVDARGSEEHPLWALVGIAGSGTLPVDGSINHDRDLYDRFVYPAEPPSYTRRIAEEMTPWNPNPGPPGPYEIRLTPEPPQDDPPARPRRRR